MTQITPGGFEGWNWYRPTGFPVPGAAGPRAWYTTAAPTMRAATTKHSPKNFKSLTARPPPPNSEFDRAGSTYRSGHDLSSTLSLRRPYACLALRHILPCAPLIRADAEMALLAEQRVQGLHPPVVCQPAICPFCPADCGMNATT